MRDREKKSSKAVNTLKIYDDTYLGVITFAFVILRILSKNKRELWKRESTTRMASKEKHCQFFLSKKKRYCRFTPKQNATYCPEHACVMGIQEDRKRIPCPLNPNHNCYEDELQKHIKKCNVTKSRQAIEKLPYFVKNVNKGTRDDTESDTVSTLESVKDLTSERLRAMIEKVNKLYSDVVEDVERLYLEHPRIKEEIVGNMNNDLTTAFGDQAVLRKEMLQQASLVGQLDNLGFLSNGHHFVELGAGKGKLSHWIHKSIADCTDNSFLLVERSSVRYKVDPYHKGEQKNEGNFQRIKIDIQDFCLGKVPGIQEKDSIVIVGKHLCGGATDLGIRCAVNTLQPTTSTLTSHNQSPPATENVGTNIDTDTKSRMNIHEDKYFEHSAVSSKRKEVATHGSLSQRESSQYSEESEDLPPNNERVIDNFVKESNVEPPEKVARLDEDEQRKCQLQCIMIALCCHHRCTWDTYVGQEFMRMHGVSEVEFDILTRLSSWATCARTRIRGKTSTKKPVAREDSVSTENNEAVDTATQDASGTTGSDSIEKKEEEEDDHRVEDLIGTHTGDSVPLREKLSVLDREIIGRRAKRIIDQGRIEYLKSKNLNCFLREYITDDITPENIVLIATAPKKMSSLEEDLSRPLKS